MREERLHCGSRSMTRMRSEGSLSSMAAATFCTDVVFATPPLLLTKAITSLKRFSISLFLLLLIL